MLRQNGHHGPLDASVGTTFSASMSESVDIEVIDQIIARARDATSFAQVHDAYSSVLELNGIRPSSDKAYYQFLLKLGMIRAGTWGERWDVWQAQHGSIPSRPASRVPTALRTPNPMRARVPFLASASSDLDEGYADEEGSDPDTDVPPTRESPRKAFVARGVRSLVGYTPVQSDVEEETFDVPLPIRTSTPVLSQTPSSRDRRAAISPTPPTYSESELDTSRTTTVEYVTPKPRRSIRDLSPAAKAQMEAQADAFHRMGLLGRCFEVWLQSEDWIRRTTEQIDSVRNTLLLRQTLGRWRELHEAHLELPGTADAHYAHRVMRQTIDTWLAKLRDHRLEKKEKIFTGATQHVATQQAWLTWRRKLVNRRTEVWAADLRRREKLATARVSKQLLQRTFTTWRVRTRAKQADVHYVTVLAERHFVEWRRRAEQSRALSDKLAVWDAQHSTSKLAQNFRLWKGKVALRTGEREFTARRDTRVVARVWSQWRVTKTRQRVARAFDERRVMNKSMTRMVKVLRAAQFRQRKAAKFAAARDGALMRSVFDTWARHERVHLLTGVRNTRLKKSALAKWREAIARRQQLERDADNFAAASKVKSLHRALSRWRDTLGQKHNAALKADLIFEARTKSKALIKLQAATAKATDNAVTADKAYAFFALRSGFKAWRKRLVRRRLRLMIEKRHKRVLADTMKSEAWCEATAQSIVDRDQVEKFRAAQNRRLLSSMVSRWTERVVEIKARELDVAEHRDAVILQGVMRRWRAAHIHKQDLEALLQSHLDIKREDSMRRAFLLWLQRARRSRDLRQRAEFLQQERDERLRAEAFSKWYDLKRERDLQPIAAEIALRHEDALLFSVFDAMLEHTPLVRGIQFDKQRLRRAIFPRWQRALQRTREVKRAAAEHDHRLIVDAFAIWRGAFQLKAARKHVPRRRRISARVELPAASAPASARATLDPEIVEPRRRAPRRSVPAYQSYYRAATASPDRDGGHGRDLRRAGSVASEPAYDRLRNELRSATKAQTGRRIASDEQRTEAVGGGNGSGRGGGSAGGRAESRPTSELVRALRGGR